MVWGAIVRQRDVVAVVVRAPWTLVGVVLCCIWIYRVGCLSAWFAVHK